MQIIFPATLLFSLLICTLQVSGQKEVLLKSDTIITVTHLDPRVDELVNRYQRTNKIRGYRIQIISSSKKEAAKKAKSKFASGYSDIIAHETYQQPFFIIKVGDFLTKLEAEHFHNQIEEEYPGSFVLPDFIEPFEQYAGKKED